MVAARSDALDPPMLARASRSGQTGGDRIARGGQARGGEAWRAMRLLFDINHPVQAHVFRPVVEALRARGDEAWLVARDKDVTLGLLERFGMPAQVLAPIGRGPAGWLRELVVREARLLRLARRTRPDLIVGTTVSGARVARLTGGRSVVVNDDDASAVPFFRWLAYPLASVIVTPECLRHEGHARQRTYAGCQQLFYLHPRRFVPDPAVRRELGLSEAEPYALVRLSARAAHHDRGVRGLGPDTVLRLQSALAGRVRLFVSAEGALPPPLAPLRLALPSHRLHRRARARLVLRRRQPEHDGGGGGAGRARVPAERFRGTDQLPARAGGRRPGARVRAGAGRRSRGRDRKRAVAAGSRAATRRRERWLDRVGDPLPWFLRLLDEVAGARAA